MGTAVTGEEEMKLKDFRIFQGKLTGSLCADVAGLVPQQRHQYNGTGAAVAV